MAGSTAAQRLDSTARTALAKVPAPLARWPCYIAKRVTVDHGGASAGAGAGACLLQGAADETEELDSSSDEDGGVQPPVTALTDSPQASLPTVEVRRTQYSLTVITCRGGGRGGHGMWCTSGVCAVLRSCHCISHRRLYGTRIHCTRRGGRPQRVAYAPY